MHTCCELLIHFCPLSHSCLYWTSFILSRGWADLLLISVCFGGKGPTHPPGIRYVAEGWCNPHGLYGNRRMRSRRLLILIFPHPLFQSLSLSLFLSINVLLCRLYHSSTFGRRCEEMSRLKGSGERNEEGLSVIPSLHSLERHVQRLLLHSCTSNLHKSHYSDQALN